MKKRVDFDVVEIKGTRRWVDASGKNRQKTQTFSQTLNPFNVNADGSIKSKAQVLDELYEERKQWLISEGGLDGQTHRNKDAD